MLSQAALSQALHQPWLLFPVLIINNNNNPTTPMPAPLASSLCRKSSKITVLRSTECRARRRVRYDDDDDDDEEYGYNAEIAMLESYTESARSEALLVRAAVDGEEELVLIFKGMSSCLSSRTASDPSKSVLPANAIIRSVDVVKGPFDPSNIEYIEKALTWEAFKTRLQPN